MSNSWDPGFVSAPAIARWRTFVKVPVTNVDPPMTATVRTGPSSYRQVLQGPMIAGELKVFLLPETATPQLRCVVNINGALVWKHVIMGQARDATSGGKFNPMTSQVKDPRTPRR